MSTAKGHPHLEQMNDRFLKEIKTDQISYSELKLHFTLLFKAKADICIQLLKESYSLSSKAI